MSLLSRLGKQNEQAGLGNTDVVRKDSSKSKSLSGDLEQIKEKAHKELLEEWDNLPFAKENALPEKELRGEIETIVHKILETEKRALTIVEENRIIERLLNEIIGFGPITDFIEDDTISEIMVNGPAQIYVERHGKIEKTDVVFRNDAHVMHVIEKIVSPLGRHIDESSPMVDARLPDGSRVNAIIPPLSLVGPVVTIRKFSRDPFVIGDLINFGTLTPKMAKLLQACVEGRLNILVSGGTGSGKTTTLNVLSSFIPRGERIVTIEDAAELQLKQEHVVRMESRPPNIEGKGAITIWDLVRNSLRMRPDRIIVGEVRGGEALDMLQAMNTGHDGSLTTGHSNSPRDMLARLETMVMMAGMDLPVRAIREQIASAIDLIVHQERFRDGSRRITHITEVLGMEGDVITLQDIFIFNSKGQSEFGRMTGQFCATGIRPKFMEKISQQGVDMLPSDLFENDTREEERKCCI